MGGPVQTESTDSNVKWIPLLDYAVARGVSTSTLRRYIKAKKIRYKIENGRYLLYAETNASLAPQPSWEPSPSPSFDISAFTRVRELEEKLAQAREQISELKMLVAIYEEKLSG